MEICIKELSVSMHNYTRLSLLGNNQFTSKVELGMSYRA